MLKVFILEGQINCYGSHVDMINSGSTTHQIQNWVDEHEVRIYLI